MSPQQYFFKCTVSTALDAAIAVFGTVLGDTQNLTYFVRENYKIRRLSQGFHASGLLMEGNVEIKVLFWLLLLFTVVCAVDLVKTKKAPESFLAPPSVQTGSRMCVRINCSKGGGTLIRSWVGWQIRTHIHTCYDALFCYTEVGEFCGGEGGAGEINKFCTFVEIITMSFSRFFVRVGEDHGAVREVPHEYDPAASP